MRETIYTIPVNEAFDKKCECAVCEMEDTLEKKYIEYFQGPSLMEPDSRIETNEKGFCKKHLKLLFESQKNKLGFALMLDTFLNTKIKLIENLYDKYKGGLKQQKKPTVLNYKNKIIELIERIESSCIVCEKINNTLDRYMDVLFYLLRKDDAFLEKFYNQDGFCMVHFRLLIESSQKYLKAKDFAIFFDRLSNMQIKSLKTLNSDINWFTLKFDYRNTNKPWGNSKNAVSRSINKLKGLSNSDKNIIP